MNDRLDISALSDDACDNLIQIFMKARPNLAVELVALTNEEPDPDPACGRFRGCVKNWWPVLQYDDDDLPNLCNSTERWE